MEIRRFMNNKNQSLNLQIKSESTSKKKIMNKSSDHHHNNNNNNHVPDLSDFMNDMFFGTTSAADHKKAYNLTGNNSIDHDHRDRDHDRTEEEEREEGIESGRVSVSGKMTQEWLEEARRIVATSPSRCDSPSRLVGSPRFAAAAPSVSSLLDRRDPLSRSARRHREVESFSGEIISKSTKHSRNKSETFNSTDSPDNSPASTVHKWFSNILKPPNPTPPPQQQQQPTTQIPTNTLTRPPSFPRKTRFQTTDHNPLGRNLPGPTPFSMDPNLLSPPKNLIESAQRRSVSASTCSTEKIIVASKKLGSSTSFTQSELGGLNGFLKQQRTRLNDGTHVKARIVLSGPSNSTSSMVAAICYAWLLENRMRKEKKKEEEDCVIVPVMNVKRVTMWKLQEASWLFHHVNLDVSSLLFADEVDLEGLIMAGKLSMLVIGQDVLRINGEVKSQCTILTDNYCEEAYDLLQTPTPKKLLLAAILLDTENLNSSAQMSMTRDAEAVQLLLVGSPPNYRNTLFDQLTQVQRDESFLEALRQSYGKPPNESGYESEDRIDHKVSERKNSHSIPHREEQKLDKKTTDPKNTKNNKVSPKSDKPSSSLPQGPLVQQAKVTPPQDPSRGKNKFSLAKWFGFGSK